MPGQDPVLVIDDDFESRSLVVRYLEKEGFNVTEAGNGRQGLEQYHARKPAAILLDLIMPEMDGFQFVQELHKIDPQRTTPIVVLTGKDLTPEERQRLNGGVSQIVQKGDPGDLEGLLQLLHQEIKKVLVHD